VSDAQRGGMGRMLELPSRESKSIRSKPGRLQLVVKEAGSWKLESWKAGKGRLEAGKQEEGWKAGRLEGWKTLEFGSWTLGPFRRSPGRATSPRAPRRSKSEPAWHYGRPFLTADARRRFRRNQPYRRKARRGDLTVPAVKRAARVTVQAALSAICPALSAIEVTLNGKNRSQLILHAALMRFCRPLEGRKLPPGALQRALGRLQAALGRLQRALGSSQRARIVCQVALFI
jgi:hypothetical protein